MPPEVLHFRPLLTPLVQFSPPPTTRTQENQPSSFKSLQGIKRMNLTKKKFIPVLVMILAIISIFRFLRLIVSTPSSSPRLSALPPPPQNSCSPPSSIRNEVALQATRSSKQPLTPPSITSLTEEEFKVLSNLISQRFPCNLLIFGFQPQYLNLSLANAAGSTIFLEDDPDKIRRVRITSNSTRIYKVEYKMQGKEAYKLLQHARQDPDCAPNTRRLQKSKCKLALKNLPAEVYKKNWDVIIVDGPSGDAPEAPGRMATIYTASVLARKGSITSVLVHDVDRMIEKWFSWEFLCDENLFHSKGKLWHFNIRGQVNSTSFCSTRVYTIGQYHSAHYRNDKMNTTDLTNQRAPHSNKHVPEDNLS